MKITFLGVWMASDVGETVSFVIDNNSGERILVDCGTNLVSALKKAKIDPNSITHIIVTHTHGDHISGLPTYLFYRFIYAPGVLGDEVKPLKIICSEEAMKDIQNYISIPYDVLTFHPSLKYTSCNTIDEYFTESMRFKFFETKHTPLTYGFICDNENYSFVYSADTACDERIIKLASKKTLIHDVAATHEFLPLSKGHTLCDQISPLLEKYKIKKFIPVHRLSIYDDIGINKYIDEIKNHYSGELIIPSDGLSIYMS